MSLSNSDSASPTRAAAVLPVVRQSAHMRSIAYILRQAARWTADPENKTTYQSASDDLESAADSVAETEEELARLSARVAELEGYIDAHNAKVLSEPSPLETRVTELEAALRDALMVANSYKYHLMRENKHNTPVYFDANGSYSVEDVIKSATETLNKGGAS